MAAVSCGEVMYGAYYPYLYGRGAARTFHHHAPHYQYERLNVGGGGGGGCGESYAAGGAGSPVSPRALRLRAKDEELSAHGGASSESEGECAAGSAAGGAARARAHYVSANCVVFTHYAGDVATVVDEHFTRALSLDKPKESVPMVSRNLPASFFNAAAGGGGGGGGGGGSGVELYEYDPWHQHYGGYGPAAAQYHAAAHAHNMAAAAYPGLLLPRGALHAHAQYKPVEWGPQHASHLDPSACTPYTYPTVPGLDAQVQDTSKDLYWF